MRTETINIYTFEEHPDQAACLDYIRNNWHDLGQHCVDEMIDSLKELAEYVNGKLDYSISLVPDRGEFVRITDFNPDGLKELYKKKDDCPLTGVCYDIDVIEGLHNGTLGRAVLDVLHTEGEYIYSDNGLKEMIEANVYEFYENGKVV